MGNLLFMVPLLTGFVFVVMGGVMFRFPPRKINSLYGYRTTASKKNQSQWDFAQSYSAKLMMKLGALLILVSFGGLIFKPGEPIAGVFTLLILFTVIAILTGRTEAAIKRRFSSN